MRDKRYWNRKIIDLQGEERWKLQIFYGMDSFKHGSNKISAEKFSNAW